MSLLDDEGTYPDSTIILYSYYKRGLEYAIPNMPLWHLFQGKGHWESEDA